MKNYKFTIFTPCYNGEKTIQRGFDSVLGQTYDHWEWIIINDGSADQSESVIHDLIAHASPSQQERITFLSQENLGKHQAWNKAVAMATGDFFVPADCDDSFVPETLEFFNQKANEIAGGNFMTSKFSGINVSCYDPETNNYIGTKYPKDGFVSNNIELEYRYQIRGEHWGCISTHLLKERPFPKVSGHFYVENFLWYDLALRYSVVCYNKMLRAYYYEPTSLVNNSKARYDVDRARMFLDYRIWVIRNAGGKIFNYSKKSYFLLYKELIKDILRVIYLTLRKH